MKNCMHHTFAVQFDGAPERAIQRADVNSRWLNQDVHFLAMHRRADELPANLHALCGCERLHQTPEDLLQFTNVLNGRRCVTRRQVREFYLFDGREHSVAILLPAMFSGRSLWTDVESPHGSTPRAALYWGMHFDAPVPARRRALEEAQRYRGITFTDRGEILLNASNVKDGRVTLSQGGQRLSLLPETIFSIHQAWKDGDIPLDGIVPWECSTFSAQDSEADEVRCLSVDKDGLLVSDKRRNTEISISMDQLKSVVECIVEPWLANFPSERLGNQTPSAQPQASQSKSIPVVDLF